MNEPPSPWKAIIFNLIKRKIREKKAAAMAA